MINVTLTESGSIKMSCTRCGYNTVVDVSWAGSYLWELFAGQGILVMLGHLKKDHV